MRQVSFTLLMTRRCDSNPAQYERNRRFGHLVHVLGRSADGAKLPSVGLCLNASKAESRLDTATILLGLLICAGKDSPRTPSRSRVLALQLEVLLDFPDHSLGRVEAPNRL